MTVGTGGTLDYATTDRIVPRFALHRWARMCGVLPLGLGFSTYLLFLLTRWMTLPIAGLFVLLIGVGCFFAGVICLSVYRWQISRAQPDDVAAALPLFRRDLAILLINLPAAAFCTISGGHLAEEEQFVDVTVINASSAPLDRVTLTMPAASLTTHLPTIAVGEFKSPTQSVFRRREARALRFTVKQPAGERSGALPQVNGDFDSLEITITDTSVTARGVVW